MFAKKEKKPECTQAEWDSILVQNEENITRIHATQKAERIAKEEEKAAEKAKEEAKKAEKVAAKKAKEEAEEDKKAEKAAAKKAEKDATQPISPIRAADDDPLTRIAVQLEKLIELQEEQIRQGRFYISTVKVVAPTLAAVLQASIEKDEKDGKQVTDAKRVALVMLQTFVAIDKAKTDKDKGGAA